MDERIWAGNRQGFCRKEILCFNLLPFVCTNDLFVAERRDHKPQNHTALAAETGDCPIICKLKSFASCGFHTYR
ncbi:hypothetical protein SeMB42_g03340 [Synchytrium endobioticum]|uniref:Uncharacterized protein n=1 Tax=Synchytrium endobioticum TaxID=286115 RepID=A0A507D924_9FUNG|nr:hypothetical protein SeMB42_g03340 [Synchytrium endobioticum]